MHIVDTADNPRLAQEFPRIADVWAAFEEAGPRVGHSRPDPALNAAPGQARRSCRCRFSACSATCSLSSCG